MIAWIHRSDYTARRPSTSGRLPRKRSNRHRHNGNRDIRGSLCTRRSLATQSARLWRAPREQKIAFRAMREMGVRGILIYYSNYKPRVWPFARQKYFRFFAEWQPSSLSDWTKNRDAVPKRHPKIEYNIGIGLRIWDYIPFCFAFVLKSDRLLAAAFDGSRDR
jgi:hypothetical protein